ncbi:AMP-binding protein [Labrenzia sp. PO1]|uniref:AMP-binding protein n=1 Tax=Labrenzia sp. PO1 TaxID=2720390 RepID=UPI001445B88A|nr:AMP-binding protein [Labrenzia sp. PO1]NKI58361.1 AMP-binding protein [Labrenzia sp. PO1]
MRNWKFTLSDSAALVDADQGQTVTYAEMPGALCRTARRLARWQTGAPHFLLARNCMDHALTILSAFQENIPLALVDPELAPEQLTELIGIYKPASLIGDQSFLDTYTLPGYSRNTKDEAGLCQLVRDADKPIPTTHPDLACLLSTSGSTGAPKFVRLSSTNLISNARAIAEVLEIGPGVVSLGHLKFHYSFGLSVLTSHLLAGGTVVLTGATIAERGFWEAMSKYEVAVLPCVPFHCEYICRLGLKRLRLEHFKTIIQAGGACRQDIMTGLDTQLQERDGRFFVMYGQTEASPRMTTLPAQELAAHPGSVGSALPGGRIEIQDTDGRRLPCGQTGEVVYFGPNVMMGYASSADDLKLGNITGGCLRTGDLGFLSDEGYLTVTGRAARFAKVYGNRVSLHDVEKIAAARFNQECVAVEGTDQIRIFIERSGGGAADEVLAEAELALCRELRLPNGSVKVHRIDGLPRKTNGKPDYVKLTSF